MSQRSLRLAAVEHMASLGLAVPTISKLLTGSFVSLMADLHRQSQTMNNNRRNDMLVSQQTIYNDLKPILARTQTEIIEFMRLDSVPFTIMVDQSRLPNGSEVTGVLAKTIEGVMLIDSSFIASDSLSLVTHIDSLLRSTKILQNCIGVEVDPGSTVVSAARSLPGRVFVCVAHVFDTVCDEYCAGLQHAMKLILALNAYLHGGGNTHNRQQRAAAASIRVSKVNIVFFC